jgi:ABC-type Fe3+-citrate transport system substrate-binding protein
MWRWRNAFATSDVKNTMQGLASSTELTQTETQYQDALQSMFMAAQNALDKKSELEYLMTKQQKQ